MYKRIKRLRIFAGPNGSGKSTLYDYLVRIGAFQPYYFINADAIARDLPFGTDFSNYPIELSEKDVKIFLDGSSFQNIASYRLSKQIEIRDKSIYLKNDVDENITYLAAAIADYVRHKMIVSDSSFSFESVFSHTSKLTEIQTAKHLGFKTYLYFVSTSNPSICTQRVYNRAYCGGHNVPQDKVKLRYYRTMENLYDAFSLCDSVFFFDNSSEKFNGTYNFFAEKNNAVLSYNDYIPKWFNDYILNKLVLSLHND